ncbi:hypothetical protein CPB86DRAFT_704104, partial [Serendipita vermifera]
QRRDEFRKCVADAINSGTLASTKLELLRDMPVRWSSTFNMIERFLILSPAVDLFLARTNHRDLLFTYRLGEVELEVLREIRQILLLFHSIQELLSSERTPTLAVALPAYEYCLATLAKVIDDEIFPHLNHALRAAAQKLGKYVELARKNRIYGMSMCKYHLFFKLQS